ncbi:winged helix-turn-helix domain-containing protein [Saccharothrix coeruleofusca]|uniref:OmpR/PhoB-type domain-containing protein n=1 Tax=Saccharothrix coeruleofusca TaxID=33919 RepID=A0A918EGC2_9PSEU|nr:winged helix-turn-helix domain-containing protein [Saccharothrix coeruleofusca]MBP2335307.1 DNA-binding response OmpR family regulator [Saccharothrix coeruleofusca]GGP72085.1 hypothetical protein GCM10010185_51840 [Saccharothrix coeruleofusca]
MLILLVVPLHDAVNAFHLLDGVDPAARRWCDRHVAVTSAFPDVTSVDVTVVIRLTARSARASDAASRLADALKSALDLPGAEVLVDTADEPAVRVLADSRQVLHRGRSVELTRLEFDLLLHLCRYPRQVHRRSALMNVVWGTTSFVDTRTVDVHVRRIRQKLGDAASLISTVRGVGYRVDDPRRVLVVHDGQAP